MPRAGSLLRTGGCYASVAFAWGCPYFFALPLPPLDVADNGLSTFVDVDVFDGHFLLALAPVFVEGFHLCCEGSCQLIEGPFRTVLLGDVLNMV